MFKLPELTQVTSELQARGVLGVSLFFSPTACGTPKDTLARDAMNFNRAALDGKHKPAEPIGDTMR